MSNRMYRLWTGALDEVELPAGTTPKDVLGGKGAGLHDMVKMGLRVPPAFTIVTGVSLTYLNIAADQDATTVPFMDNIMTEASGLDDEMSDLFGYSPLLSVRSGAAISMPGMMDTVLNVGLSDDTLPEWCARIGERAAWDSYRRLIQMLGATAFGIDMRRFDERLAIVKEEAGVSRDTELSIDNLKEVVALFKECFTAYAYQSFPQTREAQLRAAIEAVFRSWNNERAIEYRRLNAIPDTIGTAVTVQAMVFGNMGDTSATGVLFSRDPSTGARTIMGEYLVNAQGEDVVAGIRTPLPLSDMLKNCKPNDELWCVIHAEIEELLETLEAHYNDMVDVEFTVQTGTLYVLQARIGKRSAIAAFRIGVDLYEAGVIDRDTLFSRITRAQYRLATRPALDPAFKTAPVASGLPACPGVASGRVVLTAKEAIEASDPVILVTHETDPDDIGGMARAVGILTATGGVTSHAAVVARGMDKPCVVGCTALSFSGSALNFGNVGVMAGSVLSLCGATGRVWLGAVPTVDGSQDAAVGTVTDLAMQMSGAVETAPVDPGSDAPVRVMAADWWGSADVLDAVLDGLAALPSRDHVSLDITSPADFLEPSDLDLLFAFGSTYPGHFDPDFRHVIVTRLGHRAHEVPGLVVIGCDPKQRKQLRAYGLRPTGAATTIADLMTGAPMTLTAEFIETVIGGQSALDKLKHALAASGYGIKPVPPALPRDYATLSALAP